MNAMWTIAAEPAEPVDIALGDLLPQLQSAAGNRWGLHTGRCFWYQDAEALHPLAYHGPDRLVVRGDPVAPVRLAHAASLALLRYYPAKEAGMYDLICHGLATDLARRVTGQSLEGPLPEAMRLACALLRLDGDLALRVRALGDEPPPISAVAPLVFDRELPKALRRRLGQAARVGDELVMQSARREAALWRWLSGRRFGDLWPELLAAIEDQGRATSLA